MKHLTTQPVTALPHAMSERDIVREHEESLARVVGDHNVHLRLEDGGAAAGSRVPVFPAAHRHEGLAFYRHRVQGPMRAWVRFVFSDLAAFPGEEPIAQEMAATFAQQEIRRALTYFETRQIAAAVRDILTSHWLEAAARREDRIRGEEWLAEQQEGHES